MRALPAPGIFSRTDVRLAGFGLVAVLAVSLGFFGVPAGHAAMIIKHGGYYLMLFTFALWVWSLLQLRRQRSGDGPGWSRRERVVVGLLMLTFTGAAVAQESLRSKVLYDEFVLQSTAFNLHYFREVATMVRGYDILGTFLPIDNYLDKRPYFYPFLVSLVHDFTGYRPGNAYWLNVGLFPVALGLAYQLGRSLTGWRGGMLAMVLLGSLPLVAQNATGSGMEMLNLTMVLATVALAGAFLARPDEASLSAVALAAVLLAQCRYESALYVLPVALAVITGWWRTRRITISWTAVLVPALFLPVALHNKVLASTPILWEMKENQTSRFGVEYVAGNLRDALEFLLSLRTAFANSLLLSLLGGAALLWAIGWLAVRRPRLTAMEPHRLAWGFFGLGILLNTALVMLYFWSSFTDPVAARFSLPFCLLLVFAAVMLVGWLDRWLAATPVALAIAAVCFLDFSIPKEAYHLYSHTGIDEIEWERRLVEARPSVDRLIVTNKSTLPWLVLKIPSILLKRARTITDRLQEQLAEPASCEILVMQEMRPTSAEGEHAIVAEDRLPAGFHLKLIAEKRFGTKIARISRLVAVDINPAAPTP